jgi:hypothetical protein
MTSKLADQLRALPDDGLGALLQLRPDLVIPLPPDIGSLASRLQSRESVSRVLDQLDRFTLEVLDGLRLVRDSSGVAAVSDLLALTTQAGVSDVLVHEALNRLRARFLTYRPDEDGYDNHGATLRLVGAIDELTPATPAGLGRPAGQLDPLAGALTADPAQLRRTVLLAPPEARAVLDRLAVNGPLGSVQPSVLRSPQSDTPVRWLIDKHLLVPVASDLVELPREVAILLRRDHGPLGALHPTPPETTAPQRSLPSSPPPGRVRRWRRCDIWRRFWRPSGRPACRF